MDWKLELVMVPVSDVQRAKDFYADQVGFAVDLDHQIDEDVRIVQLTPRGSGCSINLSTGLSDATPGSAMGLQIVVSDIEHAHAELVERGVDVTPVRHLEGSEWVDGKGGRWNSFVHFTDPDGNPWTLQEAPAEA